MKIKVEVPTYIAGILDFESGAIGTLITSFDIKGGSKLPRMEIYGSEGTLFLPDPNSFGGPVAIRRADTSEWLEVPLTHGSSEESRGIGAADMAYALLAGRKHRADGEMAYHVLDIMHAFHDSSKENRHCFLKSTCKRPEPLPIGFPAGIPDCG